MILGNPNAGLLQLRQMLLSSPLHLWYPKKQVIVPKIFFSSVVGHKTNGVKKVRKLIVVSQNTQILHFELSQFSFEKSAGSI